MEGVGEGSSSRPLRSPDARVRSCLSLPDGRAAPRPVPETPGVLAPAGPRRQNQESRSKESYEGHTKGKKAAPRTGVNRRLRLHPASPPRARGPPGVKGRDTSPSAASWTDP